MSRVMWFLPEYPPNPGGIATFAVTIMAELFELGHEMHALVSWGGPSRELHGGVDIIREPIKSAQERGSATEVLRAARTVADLKTEILPDLYHLHVSDASPVLHLATSSVAAAPTVLTLHNQTLDQLEHSDPNSLLRRLLDTSTVIVGVSGEVVTQATDKLPELSHRLVTIPNGLSLGDASPPYPESPNILAIGRLVSAKGFDRAVRAMPRLLEQHPGAHLSIVGEGPERDDLQRLIDDRELQEVVTLHGHVPHPQVGQFLAGAQVVVAPSDYEGMPYAVLEAARAARPIVGTRVSGISEIVEDGRTGLLFDPAQIDADPTILGTAIGSLLTDPSRAREMGEYGRERVEQLFSARRCATAHGQVYRAVTRPPVDLAVIIPAFNAERHLGAALDSAIAAADATLHSTQIMVIDDGSTDATAEIAARYAALGVELFRQPNLGMGLARNAGLALTSSRFVAHLDADDVWPRDRLQVLLEPLDADDSLDACFGRVVEFADHDAPLGARLSAEPVVVRTPTSGVLRRDMHERCGGFHSGFENDQVEWCMRAERVGINLKCIESVGLRRRIHRTNNSHVRRSTKESALMRLLKSKLDGERAAQPDAP